MTEYLVLDDALHITDRLGFHVRDAGLLASALARPATTVFGDDAYPSFSLKAAALLESIVRNHPIIDGNKRSGWTMMIVFLRVNGWRHTMDVDTGFALVVGVADGRVGLEASAEVIGAHIRRREP